MACTARTVADFFDNIDIPYKMGHIDICIYSNEHMKDVHHCNYVPFHIAWIINISRISIDYLPLNVVHIRYNSYDPDSVMALFTNLPPSITHIYSDYEEIRAQHTPLLLHIATYIKVYSVVNRQSYLHCNDTHRGKSNAIHIMRW
jgi:hypothetical protein